ncbi:MAG: hypothetical protein WD988_02260, partial [Candidatus Curtissbacteria bacterium]
QFYARLFSVVCGGPRRSRIRVLWQLESPLTLRKHLALAARSARDTCSVLASCSLRGFDSVRGKSSQK